MGQPGSHGNAREPGGPGGRRAAQAGPTGAQLRASHLPPGTRPGGGRVRCGLVPASWAWLRPSAGTASSWPLLQSLARSSSVFPPLRLQTPILFLFLFPTASVCLSLILFVCLCLPLPTPFSCLCPSQSPTLFRSVRGGLSAPCLTVSPFLSLSLFAPINTLVSVCVRALCFCRSLAVLESQTLEEPAEVVWCRVLLLESHTTAARLGVPSYLICIEWEHCGFLELLGIALFLVTFPPM